MVVDILPVNFPGLRQTWHLDDWLGLIFLPTSFPAGRLVVGVVDMNLVICL